MNKELQQDSQALNQYIDSVSLRDSDVLRRLREETAKDSAAVMQIPAQQGQFMALLVKLIGARRTIEIGTYTGYSTLCVAAAMTNDSYTVACDTSEYWTDIARRYWQEAGVADKIDLRLGPAADTLEQLLTEGQQSSFDFAFIDADKYAYDNYYEKCLELLRPGGLIAIDNVLLFGSVYDDKAREEVKKIGISAADISSMQALNLKIRDDKRVELSMLPLADGLSLVQKK